MMLDTGRKPNYSSNIYILFSPQLAIKVESMYKISAFMGNSPEICRRHYAALIPESFAESVEFVRIESINRKDSA